MPRGTTSVPRKCKRCVGAGLPNSSYGGRIHSLPWGNDAFCKKSHHPWLEAPHAVLRRAPKRTAQPVGANSNCAPSGRQDSNLRPLVPQTSPYLPMSAEFDLEWFLWELVGMTTRARLLEPPELGWTMVRIKLVDVAPRYRPSRVFERPASLCG